MDSKKLEQTAQDSENRTETGQKTGQKPTTAVTRHKPKTHLDRLTERLQKRRYKVGENKYQEIPDWQIRLFDKGREAWFNLETSNEDLAARKAKVIAEYLKANGLDATISKFKRPTIAKDTLTVREFSDIYREALRCVEYPPSPQTAARYLKSLEFICGRERVNCIADLTPEIVKKFRSDYRQDGRKDERKETSIMTSCNAMLRNAAAVFSRQMLAEYKLRNLALANPFEGQKFRRIELENYMPLNRDLLDAIWRDAVKLRDGNPEAPERVRIRTGGRKAKLPPGEKSKRWKDPDLRQPQPGAYVLLLLELGLGLRRNEADKAQWDWFYTDAHGRHYLTVKATPYFTPKSKKSRIIPVEKLLYDAIQATREQVSPFIVPGLLPKKYEPGKEPKNLVYRCDQHHRTLAAWLRKQGIADDKPCHLLRKEFGSYVATAFGLFHAQRMLGHSSPKVTEAFYAGLTQLPELNHAQIKG
jgi:hypothetical protein